jgi:hypothetical protein
LRGFPALSNLRSWYSAPERLDNQRIRVAVALQIGHTKPLPFEEPNEEVDPVDGGLRNSIKFGGGPIRLFEYSRARPDEHRGHECGWW